MEILVGVSNRHVHLTREDLNILFGTNYQLTKRNDLVQKGQFAANETVTLKTKDNVKEFVRIIGPLRNYTQVELLESDKDYFKINPPFRDSGDLANSETITIVGPQGEITRENSCIISTRHIHINSENTLGFSNGQIVSVKTKKGINICDVHIKISNENVLEFQLNKDEAPKFDLQTGDIVYLETGD